MANCKDCLHYQVCGYVMDMSDNEIEEPGAEKACQHFLRDAAPVVRGRWAIDEEDIKWGNSLKKRYCTNCGKRPHFDKENREFILSNYCPNCGAKMDGGKEK